MGNTSLLLTLVSNIITIASIIVEETGSNYDNCAVSYPDFAERRLSSLIMIIKNNNKEGRKRLKSRQEGDEKGIGIMFANIMGGHKKQMPLDFE